MTVRRTGGGARPGVSPVAPPGPTLAGRCRAAGLKLTPRRLSVMALFDDVDHPVDFEEAQAWMTAAGVRMSMSSLYRLIADLVAAGMVMELRNEGRRRYLATHKAIQFRLEDASGRGLTTAVAGLQALLTMVAVEQGLPLNEEVVLRFGARYSGRQDVGDR